MYFVSGIYLGMFLLGWGSGVYGLTMDKHLEPCKQIRNGMFQFYRNIHEDSVRYMVREHYHTLKNKVYRNTLHKILSVYYDATYYYYNLKENEMEFLDNIRGMLM
jgi:hypothetical protein